MGRQCSVQALGDADGWVVTAAAPDRRGQRVLLAGADRSGDYGVPTLGIWTPEAAHFDMTRRFDRGAEGNFEAAIHTRNGWMLAATTRGPLHGAMSDDAWLVVLDEHGQVEHQRLLGGPHEDSASALERSRGAIWMLGSTSSEGISSRSNGWVVAIDESLQRSWSATYGDGFEQGLIAAAAGRDAMLALGWRRETKDSRSRPWLLALEADGAVRWQRSPQQVRGARPSEFGHVGVEGDFWLVGRDGRKAWLARFDARGRLLTQRTIGPADAGQSGLLAMPFRDTPVLLFGGALLRRRPRMIAGFFLLGLDRDAGLDTRWARISRTGLPLAMLAVPHQTGYRIVMSTSTPRGYSVHTFALDSTAQRLDCPQAAYLEAPDARGSARMFRAPAAAHRR